MSDKRSGKRSGKSSGGGTRKSLPVYTPETKCSFCPGTKCCNYITQEIETPRSIQEFDHLLWQLAHQNVEIYKDEGTWFLCVLTACQFLKPSGACGIYETRPQICRDHSNDYCEFDAPPEDDFELYFTRYDELDNYCRKRFKGWDKRFSA